MINVPNGCGEGVLLISSDTHRRTLIGFQTLTERFKRFRVAETNKNTDQEYDLEKICGERVIHKAGAFGKHNPAMSFKGR